jgi:cytochrome c553
LVGGSANELAATMLAYRSGERPSTVMGRLMKGLTTEQIQEIAVWVAAQK